MRDDVRFSERSVQPTRDRSADTVLFMVLAVYASVYGTLILIHQQFVVFKTMVVPALVVYAIATRQARVFAIDWLPFVTATVLFDAVRGWIYADLVLRQRHILIDYVINWERSLFATPAVSIPLQQHLRSAALDVPAVALHGAHFVSFFLCGLVIWHGRREEFGRFVWSLLLVMYLGAACYFLWPTAPPWYASERGYFPVRVILIAGEIYKLYIPDLYGVFATNPVAAMPSLHVAVPTVCAISVTRAWGARIGSLIWMYAGAVGFAVVYLGEHYLIDVVAGIALAGAAGSLSQYFGAWPRIKTLRGALAVSSACVIATVLLAILR